MRFRLRDMTKEDREILEKFTFAFNRDFRKGCFISYALGVMCAILVGLVAVLLAGEVCII